MRFPFKSKQTPAAPAASAAAAPDDFPPIRVMNPEPAALSTLRSRVLQGAAKTGIMVALSPAPPDEWRAAFIGYWRQLYPSAAVPIFSGGSIIIESEIFRLRSMIEIARVVADWTNTFAGPLIRGNVAHATLGGQRRAALDAFDYEAMHSPLPDIGPYIEGTIPRAEFEAERVRFGQREVALRRKKKETELAEAEANAVIASLESLPPA